MAPTQTTQLEFRGLRPLFAPQQQGQQPYQAAQQATFDPAQWLTMFEMADLVTPPESPEGTAQQQQPLAPAPLAPPAPAPAPRRRRNNQEASSSSRRAGPRTGYKRNFNNPGRSARYHDEHGNYVPPTKREKLAAEGASGAEHFHLRSRAQQAVDVAWAQQEGVDAPGEMAPPEQGMVPLGILPAGMVPAGMVPAEEQGTGEGGTVMHSSMLGEGPVAGLEDDLLIWALGEGMLEPDQFL